MTISRPLATLTTGRPADPPGDPLEQFHHVRGVGADPEPAVGGQRLRHAGDEVQLGPGRLIGPEGGALVHGRLSHRPSMPAPAAVSRRYPGGSGSLPGSRTPRPAPRR